MKEMISCLLLISVGFVNVAFAQKELKMELIVTDEQRIIIFTGFIIAVIGIFLYLARDLILQRKTNYDKKEFESKKNKDYEKYHSDWSDDYEDFGTRNHSKTEKEFKEALGEGSFPNYYKILGIDRESSQEEIKAKYRQLAKKLHPDKSKNQETEKKMSEINRAYEILSDKELRQKYDKYFDAV